MQFYPKIYLYQLNEKDKRSFDCFLELEKFPSDVVVQAIDNISFADPLILNPDADLQGPVLGIFLHNQNTALSPEIIEFLDFKGITLVFSLPYFLSNCQCDYFYQEKEPAKKVIFLEENPARLQSVSRILSLFHLDLFNQPLKSKKLKSWQDIPDIKNYNFNLWGARPLLIINLDCAQLQLKPFLASLISDYRMKGKKEEYFFRPKILPIKDFSQGSLWDDITSGIRSFSKAILSFDELKKLMVEILFQQELKKLDDAFTQQVALNWPENLTRGGIADIFTHPQLFANYAGLHAQSSHRAERTGALLAEYRQLLCFRKGLEWICGDSNAPTGN